MVSIEVVMSYAIPVKVEYGNEGTVVALNALKWAKKNCKSYLYNYGEDVVDQDLDLDTVTVYTFYFSDKKDATWFKLKWQ